MAEYNPFQDLNPQFSYYTSAPLPKVNNNIINNVLHGDISLPEGYTVIPKKSEEEKDDYKIIAPINPINWSNIQNEMASTHGEPIKHQTTSTTVKQDLQGNKKKAMEFFQSKGLNAYQAAGIVGNLMGESNLNESAENPSGAYGIAQWLGNRKKNLIAKYGNNPTFDQQLEFLWEELNTTEKNAFDKLLKSQSLEEATNSFMKHFERPSSREMAQSIHRRIKYGKEVLA